MTKRSIAYAQKKFPKFAISGVRDLEKETMINALQPQIIKAERNKYDKCVIALAAVENHGWAAAWVGPTISWLCEPDGKGGYIAVRCGTGKRARDELRSFDQGCGFPPGNYSLTVPPKCKQGFCNRKEPSGFHPKRSKNFKPKQKGVGLDLTQPNTVVFEPGDPIPKVRKHLRTDRIGTYGSNFKKLTPVNNNAQNL